VERDAPLFTPAERRLVELLVTRLPRYAWAKPFLEEPKPRRFRRLDAVADWLYTAAATVTALLS